MTNCSIEPFLSKSSGGVSKDKYHYFVNKYSFTTQVIFRKFSMLMGYVKLLPIRTKPNSKGINIRFLHNFFLPFIFKEILEVNVCCQNKNGYFWRVSCSLITDDIYLNCRLNTIVSRQTKCDNFYTRNEISLINNNVTALEKSILFNYINKSNVGISLIPKIVFRAFTLKRQISK